MTFADALHACFSGFGSIFVWPEFGLLVAGVILGAMVGILPGLGGAATLAILLPFSVGLPPTQAFALLMGVAAVTATTGDLTSILVGIPGEAISAATMVDGHPMAVRGEGARAIGASLFSSLAGSIVGAVTLAATIPFALVAARSIGSPEFFMLSLLGIGFMASLSGSSTLKGLAIGGLGLMIATIGMDRVGAIPRFTFGQLFLWDGVGAIPVSLGLFAIPEIVHLVANQAAVSTDVATVRGRLRDGILDVRRLWPLVLQSSAIGTLLGLLPGVGAGVSQWVAYGHAARRGAEHHEFGQGAIEGVIAPSAANNATLGGSLVPALAFGIPGGLMSAMLISALIVKGLVPGPEMLTPEAQGGHLTLVFALVWLIVLANVIAVALACLSTGLLVRITRIRAARIVPFLLLLTFIGAFTERQVIADLLVTVVMGALGLALVRYGWPRAPLLLGVVLGPLAENRLFLSVDAYGSQWLLRPGVLLIAALMLAAFVLPRRAHRWKRQQDVPSPPRVAKSSSFNGEHVFILLLAALLGAAVVVAASYPPRAALAPRLVAVATLTLLFAAVASDRLKTGRSEPTVSLPFTTPSIVTMVWIPIFLVVLWGFGFVAGAPVVVLGYLLVTGRERPVRAVVLAVVTGVAVYGLLFRLLYVPFPPGAFYSFLTGYFV